MRSPSRRRDSGDGSRRHPPRDHAAGSAKAYAVGIFPMAEFGGRSRPLLDRAGSARHHPARPLPRAAAARAGRSPRRLRGPHRPRLRGVIAGCAGAGARAAPKTWINARIRRLYGELFAAAMPHRRDLARRAAGRRPLRRRGSARRSSAKACSRASATPQGRARPPGRAASNAGGFRLLDTQFTTAHLKQFGAIDVDRRHYQRLLEQAIARRGRLLPLGAAARRGMRSCGRLRPPSGTRRVRRSARAGLRPEGPADDGDAAGRHLLATGESVIHRPEASLVRTPPDP